MKILLLHNHYRIRGGEDSVFEAERDMLRAAGHAVETWEKHNDDIREGGGPFSKIGLFFHTVWNGAVYRELRARLRRDRPDIVHVHNFFPQFSPSVFWACAKERVPVVLTLHNYRLVCLTGYLYREGRGKGNHEDHESPVVPDRRESRREGNHESHESHEIPAGSDRWADRKTGNEICEACLGRSPWQGVVRRCYRGSFAASFTLATMLVVHRLLGTWKRKVTRYIALTEFAKAKFVAAGLPAEKIVVKPNAVGPGRRAGREEGNHESHEGHESLVGPGGRAGRTTGNGKRKTGNGLVVLYLGRLSSEKGVDILLDAWRQLSKQNWSLVTDHWSLLIVGDGPERETLESSVRGMSNVRFLGALPHEEAMQRQAESDVLVLPSRCYETFGLSVMEAAQVGVPSVVPDTGSHASLVEDGVTGRHFRMGSADSLASVLRELLNNPARLRAMGAAAQAAFLASSCIPEKNLSTLLEIYQEAAKKDSRRQLS